MKTFPISASRISSFECPYYFYDKYILNPDKKDDFTNINLAIGQFCHKVIDDYNKALLHFKQVSDNNIFQNVFEENWKLNDKIPESKYPEIKDLLTSFAENHLINPDTLLGTEIELALDWELNKVDWNNENVWLRAKLDQVDIIPNESTCIITDYKTNYFMPSESQLKNSLQTKIYPFIMHTLNNYLEIFIIKFHYIRWNATREIKFSTNEEIIDNKEFFSFKNIENYLRNFTLKILDKLSNKEAEWPAIVGECCPICHLDCPLTLKGISPIKNNEQAKDIGMQIIALKQKSKQLFDNLKNYCKATDQEIELEIGKYSWVQSETIKGLKADIVAQYCLDKGIDLNLLLTVDNKKLKKLEEDNILKEITSLGKKQKSVRFSFLKYAKDNDEENDTL